MRPLRVYVETSVFGGMYEPDFLNETKRCFRMVRDGRFRVVVSEQVKSEISPSPDAVKEFFDINLSSMEYTAISREVRKLAGLYVNNKIFNPKVYSDALHVACATINGCDGLISWNNKHMVNAVKIGHVNMINVINGFTQLIAVSPRGIMRHED
jgi:hypothetical protein